MTKTYSRQELLDIIWSKPTREVAEDIGVSTAAISTYCKDNDIPAPPRGHWLRAEGKRVKKPSLPPRGIGKRDIIRVGGSNGYYYSYPEPAGLMTMEIGPAPSFQPSIDKVMETVRQQVGKVAAPRDFSRAHHLIRRLLEQDEERRIKYLSASYHSYWDAPYFDAPYEKRRLRMMNALMLNLHRLGGRATMRDKNPSGFSYKVGHQNLYVTVDHPESRRSSWMSEELATRSASEPIVISIGQGDKDKKPQRRWVDNGSDKVEVHLQDIIVSMIVTAEVEFRDDELRRHTWLISRKEQLIENERKRIEEEQKRERERIEADRKARYDGLLLDAAAHRQAEDIRAYARSVGAAKGSLQDGSDVDRWLAWALAQADDIDPVVRMQMSGTIGRTPGEIRKSQADDQREKAEALKPYSDRPRGYGSPSVTS